MASKVEKLGTSSSYIADENMWEVHRDCEGHVIQVVCLGGSSIETLRIPAERVIDLLQVLKSDGWEL